MGKFASCLGAATFAWILSSLVIVPSIIILRDRISGFGVRSSRNSFEVLEEGPAVEVLRETRNGIRSKQYMHASHYYHLVDSAEMADIPQRRIGADSL
jgi:hypothetical protein